MMALSSPERRSARRPFAERWRVLPIRASLLRAKKLNEGLTAIIVPCRKFVWSEPNRERVRAAGVCRLLPRQRNNKIKPPSYTEVRGRIVFIGRRATKPHPRRCVTG